MEKIAPKETDDILTDEALFEGEPEGGDSLSQLLDTLKLNISSMADETRVVRDCLMRTLELRKDEILFLMDNGIDEWRLEFLFSKMITSEDFEFRPEKACQNMLGSVCEEFSTKIKDEVAQRKAHRRQPKVFRMLKTPVGAMAFGIVVGVVSIVLGLSFGRSYEGSPNASVTSHTAPIVVERIPVPVKNHKKVFLPPVVAEKPVHVPTED